MGVPAYTLAIPGANTTDADVRDLDAIVVAFLKAGTLSATASCVHPHRM